MNISYSLTSAATACWALALARYRLTYLPPMDSIFLNFTFSEDNTDSQQLLCCFRSSVLVGKMSILHLWVQTWGPAWKRLPSPLSAKTPRRRASGICKTWKVVVWEVFRCAKLLLCVTVLVRRLTTLWVMTGFVWFLGFCTHVEIKRPVKLPESLIKMS